MAANSEKESLRALLERLAREAFGRSDLEEGRALLDTLVQLRESGLA